MALPALSYDEACQATNLPTLKERRDDMCDRLFQAAQEPGHKLFPLIPEEKEDSYRCRNNYKYTQPAFKTNRFRNSFINYCISQRF